MQFKIIYCSADMVWLTLPDGGAVLQIERARYEALRALLNLPELICPDE